MVHFEGLGQGTCAMPAMPPDFINSLCADPVMGGQPTLPSKNTGWGGQSFYLCGAGILPEV